MEGFIVFKTHPRSLKSLLDDAGNGKIQLPDFQRDGCGMTTGFGAYWRAYRGGFRWVRS